MLVIFGLPATICRVFAKKKSVEFVEAAFNVSTETFWQKPSSFGASIFFCFFFILLLNVFPRGCQIYLIRVYRTFLRCSIGTISALSSDFEQKFFEILSIKFYHCSQNRIQYVGRIICGKFCFFFRSFCNSIFFWPQEKLLWYFWQNIINRFVRIVFCMSAGKIQQYQFSWEAFHLLVSFGRSAMVFRTFAKKTCVEFVKAAFIVSAEKVRREPFTFGKITTFFFSGLLSIVFPWFSKLLATCPEEPFEGLYWNSFSFKFGLEQKNIKLSFIKLCHCSQNSIQ